MKRLSVLLSVLVWLMVVSGCSSGKDTANGSVPSVGNSPAATAPAGPENPTDAPPSKTPDETQTTGADANHEVYTKIIQVEGNDETVRYRRIKGSFGYTMPMDVDRFEFEEGEDADTFKSTANENVYIEISYGKNITAADVARALKGDTAVVRSDESAVKLGNYDALKIHAVYGSEPKSKVADYYLIEEGGGVYAISCVYTAESAEGFGARMFYMTQDFQII